MKRIAFVFALMSCFVGSASAQMGGMAGHAPPMPMTPAQFSAATTGANVQIAVRVKSVRRANIEGQLLQHTSPSEAKATRTNVTLYYADGTPTIMGAPQDVVPGAVLFVYGVLTSRNHVDVKRLVIDTRYVHVR